MIDAKHCLFLHKSYSFAKKRPKMTKNKLFSIYFMTGRGECPPSLPCTVEAACTVLASLSFQCPSLHLMCTSNYGSLLSEQKL